MLTPQEKFTQTYIDATEIRQRMKINRSSLVTARRRQSWPEPISINDNKISLWERAMIEPLLQQWEARREARKVKRNLKKLWQNAVAVAVETIEA